MKIIKNIIVVVMGLFIVFTIYKNIFTDSRVEYFERKYLEREYRGRVVKKYVDIGNHAYRVFELSNGYVEHLPNNLNYVYAFINKNDSIIKKKGDSLGNIIRLDTTIVFNYLKSNKR